MTRTLSQRQLITQARQEIRALKRPEGMRPTTWARLRRLLSCLAGYLPNVWPATRTLANSLGRHLTQVQRDVETLRNLGLIMNIPHASDEGGLGQEYLLVCLSEGLEAEIQRHRAGSALYTLVEHKCVQKGIYFVDTGPSDPYGSSVRPAADAAGKGRLTAGGEMPNRRQQQQQHAEDWGAPTIGPDSDPGEGTSTGTDQGKRLAVIFDECWGQMANRHREWLRERPSNRGRAIQYLNGTMLTQVDAETAERYIRAFAPAVADGRVSLSEKQTPFAAFTGWRGSEPLEAPSDLPEGFADFVRQQRAQRSQE